MTLPRKPVSPPHDEPESERAVTLEVERDGWLVTVRVPSERATVPSDDAFVQVTASFPGDARAAWAWGENVRRWLTEGGSFNPDRALTLMSAPVHREEGKGT